MSTATHWCRNTLAAMAVLVALAGQGSEAAASRAPRDVERTQIQQMLVEEARANAVVPPALALAVAKVESDFSSRVESVAGARGVMQIMPATASGEFGVEEDGLWDARTNVRLGITFLERLYRQYGERWDLALSHYNGGTLRRVEGQPVAHRYTRKYVADVMAWWRHFQSDQTVAALWSTARPGTRFTVRPSAQPATVAELAADQADLDGPGARRSWQEYLQISRRWRERTGDDTADAPPVVPKATVRAVTGNGGAGRFRASSTAGHYLAIARRFW